MARFISTSAFTVPTGGAHVKYKAGTTYADTQGNAVAGDVVWIGMSSGSMSPGLIPLDAGATTMKNASPSAGNNLARPDGVNSIG
jgi:hypothetical protein